MLEKEYQPFVSVIMPIRNEAGSIHDTLLAISRQTYPHNCYELLVVDGYSTDSTLLLVNDFKDSCSYSNIRVYLNPERIFSTGFNLGLNHACGEVIVMMGGHTKIDERYIEECVKTLVNNDVDCVGGVIETVADLRISRAIAVGMSSPFGVGGVAFRTGLGQARQVDTVAFGAYKQSAFSRLGGLDVEMVRNQDDEFNYRLRENGGKILLNPSIKAKYISRTTFSKLWKQYFQYGFWKVRVLQKHNYQMQARHFVPPLFVISLLFTLLAAFLFPIGPALFALLIGSYFVANLSASIYSSSKRGWENLKFLPIVFAILHFSYGLGFLVGLFRFWNRWKDKIGKVPNVIVCSN